MDFTLIFLVATIGGVAAGFLYFFMQPKKMKAVVLNRVKPSTSESGGMDDLQIGTLRRNKETETLEIVLPDKKTIYSLPPEKQKNVETLRITRKLTLKKGFYAMFGVEGSNVVAWASKLSDASNLILDNLTMTLMMNRASARRLAAGPKKGASEFLIYVIVGVSVGLMIGYIMYPFLNHAPTSIVYCTRLTNGTVVPKEVCPP